MPLTREQLNANRRESRAAKEFNAYNNFKAEIIRIYNCASPDKGAWTHDQILERMHDLWGRVASHRRLTSFTRWKLIGVADCMGDMLFRDVLVSTCILDGKRISSKDVPSGRWAETSDPCVGVFLADGSFRRWQ